MIEDTGFCQQCLSEPADLFLAEVTPEKSSYVDTSKQCVPQLLVYTVNSVTVCDNGEFNE